MLYVAWKRGLPWKFAYFVLFHRIKKRVLIPCVFRAHLPQLLFTFLSLSKWRGSQGTTVRCDPTVPKSGFGENTNKKCLGARSFRNAAPTLWNRLPDKLHLANDIASFWWQLKSLLLFFPFFYACPQSSQLAEPLWTDPGWPKRVELARTRWSQL